MITPEPEELFFFGLSLDKFAPHKAARVIGIRRHNSNQDGQVIDCYLLQYGDGEKAYAELVVESQGAFELLTYEEGMAKHGETAFT